MQVLIWDVEAQPNRHAVLGATNSRPDLVYFNCYILYIANFLLFFHLKCWNLYVNTWNCENLNRRSEIIAPEGLAQLVEGLGSDAWLYRGLRLDPLLAHGSWGWSAQLTPSFRAWSGGPMVWVSGGAWVIKKKTKSEIHIKTEMEVKSFLSLCWIYLQIYVCIWF